MAEANSINAATTGIVGNTGTAFTGTAVTQYNVITGGATSSTLNNVAPSATSGVPVISQGSSSQPTFSTAVVAGGGTGNTTQAAYSIVCGGTTTTGAFQAVNPVATGQVLVSGGTSALPAFTAYPQISGLGIGASPGSTSGITFDGSNFMNNYVVGTWTPTIDGATPGTTTYTSQAGNYIRIGAMVYVFFRVVITAATGTGDCQVGGLPFTINGSATYNTGAASLGGTGWAWPASTTSMTTYGAPSSTFLLFQGCGSSAALAFLQMSNAAATFNGSIAYQI